MVTRVYRTKGDEAKRHHLTIPMSVRMMNRLLAFAQMVERPMADVARDLIDAGVPAVLDEKRGAV